MTAAPPRIGVVVIGRNEGARLEACLRGLLEKRDETVYVDSASTDQSVALARGLQFHVVELDALLPLNAARARNAGFLRLRQILPGLRYVQFLDGDCELDPDWIPTAQAWLESHPQTVASAGAAGSVLSNAPFITNYATSNGTLRSGRRAPLVATPSSGRPHSPAPGGTTKVFLRVRSRIFACACGARAGLS
jgi:glycosyltransferase involved in cell wall biosynthesis